MTDKPESKVLIIGVLPESLINFRGKMIKELCKHKKSVVAVSTPLSESIACEFNRLGLQHKVVNFQRNGLNPFSDLKSFLALYKLFKKEKPEFVFCYTIKPVIWGGLAARLTGVKFYALITGLGFAFQGKSLKRMILTRLVSLLYQKALKKAKKVIFQNSDNLQVFVKHNIIPIQKTAVVNGSGVDLLHFEFKSIKEPIVNLRFLCISRLLGEKGLREYAAAAKQVKKIYPSAQFILVGPLDTSPDGIPLTEVQSWPDVVYLGSAKDVRPFIEESHVYVLPSYHEGLPRSTIEAMAIGRPVLTTSAIGCKETVEEAINGFKVPVGDSNSLVEKMIWFIDNPNMLCKMGRESRRIAEEKFDVEKINVELMTIMELI